MTARVKMNIKMDFKNLANSFQEFEVVTCQKVPLKRQPLMLTFGYFCFDNGRCLDSRMHVPGVK